MGMVRNVESLFEQSLREYTERYIAAPEARTAETANEANQRARTLLLESLSPSQREDYLRQQHFFVTGSSGARYRIHRGKVSNVEVIGPDGQVHETLCGVPAVEMPIEDILLAQKLSLETDDRAFRRVAHRYSPYGLGRQVLPPQPRSRLRQWLPTMKWPSAVRLSVLLAVLNAASGTLELFRHHPEQAILPALAVIICGAVANWLHRMNRVAAARASAP